jgi:hypothetical protein
MTPQDIAGLWRLLGQTWGAKFLEQYGATPNDAWATFLSNVDTGAARYALRGLVFEGSPFPPTLPEFMAWTRKYRPLPDSVSGLTRPAIEERRCDPETAAENLRKLREMLK